MPKGVPNRQYSAEFNTKVIETLREEGLNYSEVGRRFGIEFHTLLQIWERIYLAEGPEGILDQMQRCGWIQLADVQNLLQEKLSVSSFTAGYKSAWGIAKSWGQMAAFGHPFGKVPAQMSHSSTAPSQVGPTRRL